MYLSFSRISRVALPLLLTAMIAGVGCQSSPEKSAHAENSPAQKPVPVVVESVTNAPLSQVRQFSGTVEGEQQADVTTSMPLRVVEIPVKIGNRVQKGQVVAKLDRTGPSSRYHQAKSAFDNAKKSEQRLKTLFEAGAVSGQMLDDATMQLNIARAEFEAAESAVDLTSPISGVVTAINTKIGEIPSAGHPIMSVADLSSLKIVFNIGEADRRFTTVGQAITVSADNTNGQTIIGEITQIAQSADALTRSFEVKARIPNADDTALWPGMFANVVVDISSGIDVNSIPQTAILRRTNANYVYVVEDSKAKLKAVQLGANSGLRVEISGVSVSDKVVVMGASQLEDGSPVAIVDASQFTAQSSN